MAKVNIIATEDYQAESDLRTLMEAEKIEKDPKRFKAARECAKRKLEAMMAIAAEKD